MPTTQPPHRQLRSARAKARLTPSAMAAKADLSEEAYREVEAGRRVPGRPTAVRLHSVTLELGLPVPPHAW